MLKPSILRANYKVAATQTLILENVSSLPLLFPSIQVMNRTPIGTPASLELTITSKVLFANQADPDFNSIVNTTSVVVIAAGDSHQVDLSTLLPTACGVTTEVLLTNLGPAPEVRVSIVLRGLIESSIAPDPHLVVQL